MKVGRANFVGQRYYDLKIDQKYLVDKKPYGLIVYNMKGEYIGITSLDAIDFDEIWNI